MYTIDIIQGFTDKSPKPDSLAARQRIPDDSGEPPHSPAGEQSELPF